MTNDAVPVTDIDLLWANMAERANQETDDEADDAHAIGFRDGFEIAVQKIDQLTGGDGEYRFSTDPERNCPDPTYMIRDILARHRGSTAGVVEALKLADALLRGANMNRAFVERKVSAALASIGEV